MGRDGIELYLMGWGEEGRNDMVGWDGGVQGRYW